MDAYNNDAINYQNRLMCVFTVVCFLCRGQISRDYEQEFPSVEVGPRLMRRYNEDSQTTLCSQVSVRDIHSEMCLVP